MAGLAFTVSTPTAGVAVTNSGNFVSALVITAPTAQIVKVVGFSFNLHGISTTDPSVEFAFNYVTGGSTPGGTVTPVVVNGRLPSTPNTTCKYGPWTTDPTVTTQAYASASHPQLGVSIYFPYGQELLIPAGIIMALAFKIPSGAINTVYATVQCEE